MKLNIQVEVYSRQLDMSLEAQQRLLAWRQNEKNHQHVQVENDAIGMDGTSQGRYGDQEKKRVKGKILKITHVNETGGRNRIRERWWRIRQNWEKVRKEENIERLSLVLETLNLIFVMRHLCGGVQGAGFRTQSSQHEWKLGAVKVLDGTWYGWHIGWMDVEDNEIGEVRWSI